jgi:SAM-dependent methyltransferase
VAVLDTSSRPGSYDRIADLYDIDMARNMPFDDVGLYASLAACSGGRILEIGCGNGRILLELIERGVDAIGIDVSSRMLDELRRKAAARGLHARACRMDARALGFTATFAMIFCPYSLVTYITGADDVKRMLREIWNALEPDGTVIIDAFIPQPDAGGEEFRLDYQREYRGAVLTRSKRIVAMDPGVNRVERHYELVARNGEILERIDTREDIRLFTPADLTDLLSASGFEVGQTWWDYALGGPKEGVRFFTASARKAVR